VLLFEILLFGSFAQYVNFTWEQFDIITVNRISIQKQNGGHLQLKLDRLINENDLIGLYMQVNIEDYTFLDKNHVAFDTLSYFLSFDTSIVS
jgi:hypothetical protein